MYSMYLSLSSLPCCCMSYCLRVCSVFCSPAASPELPPRYLLGQGQRPNTITHVCWYRTQNLSLTDYLRMNQVHTANRSSPATMMFFFVVVFLLFFLKKSKPKYCKERRCSLVCFPLVYIILNDTHPHNTRV